MTRASLNVQAVELVFILLLIGITFKKKIGACVTVQMPSYCSYVYYSVHGDINTI